MRSIRWWPVSSKHSIGIYQICPVEMTIPPSQPSPSYPQTASPTRIVGVDVTRGGVVRGFDAVSFAWTAYQSGSPMIGGTGTPTHSDSGRGSDVFEQRLL